MSIQAASQEKMVEALVTVDLDPSLSLYRPAQQKWITSLQLYQEVPKDIKNNSKSLTICPGLSLVINYCEKNRLPIYEIDFMPQPINQWMSIKMPSSFVQRYGQLFLSYRTEQLDCLDPLADIDILITQKKSRLFGEDKQVFTVPPGYKIINNNPITHSYLIYKRVRSNLEQTFKPILLERYPPQNKRINLSLLPLFCFPEGIHLSKELKGFISYNFILTLETGERIYVTCLSFKESLPENYRNKLKLKAVDKIYYQKAICVLSKYRYTDEFSECLKHMYRLSMSKNDVPFYKVAQSFANNMIMTQQIGSLGISYSYGGSNICFETNSAYPIISQRALFCVFKFLQIQAIINVFQAILLEKKVLFVSQSKTILGYAVEAFISLIFPFKWQHVLIPILPITLKEYLSAPVPLIAGISPILVDNTIQSDTLIVHLDTGEILNDEDLPPLPQKLQKQLRKRLEPFEYYDENQVKQYLQNPQNTYIFKMQEVEHPEFQGSKIRDIFFEFLLTLMKNYKKFWIKSKEAQKGGKYKDMKQTSSISLTQPQLLNDIFKLQDFLSDLGMTKAGSFGWKFTESTIFTAFIERRHQSSGDPQIVFFDEAIDRKKSKKQTTFIEPVKNFKYTVAQHPLPEQNKAVFSYQRFPSILKDGGLQKSQIKMHIQDQSDLPCLTNKKVLELINQQFALSRTLFAASDSSDQLDYKIQSLLLSKYKKQYKMIRQCKQKQQNYEDLAMSISSIKFKEQTREVELRYFEKVYEVQRQQVSKMLADWPIDAFSKVNFIQVDKEEYQIGFMKDKYQEIANDDIVGVFSSNRIGGLERSKNFQILMKGNCKLLLLSHQGTGKYQSQNLRSSRQKVCINIEIYIPNFQIKQFVNEIIQIQPADVFTFMVQKAQAGFSGCWTLETLLQFKDHISSSLNNSSRLLA